MKISLSIFFLIALIFADTADYLPFLTDTETSIVDSKSETKGESEGESEKEIETESEKDKEVTEENILNLALHSDYKFIEHSIYLSSQKDNYLEIYLPPPDLI